MKFSDGDQSVQHYRALTLSVWIQVSYICSEILERDYREKDDYYSQRRSRSVSRSPSPHVERHYRSDHRLPSPRENGRSPHDERDYPPSRSRSPISRSRSRSYSPR